MRRINRRDFLKVVGAGAGLLALPRWLGGAEAAAPQPRKPNIIVILVDDMGWSDISCYGSEIPTPNLDKLAGRGIRFTQFYNTARCCPTRASILTGLYPHQTGVGHMTEDNGTPGYRGRLNDQCVTLGEVMRGGGYFTAMTGKWHMGQEHGVTPWGRGFDRSLNAPAGGFYYAGGNRARLFLNGKELANDDPVLPKNWYTTDLWTDFGLRFIDESVPTKKPFFLYLAHNAPHFPLQAPADEIAKFRGKYMIGWDKLREERYKRQIAAGLVDKAWAMSPRPPEVKPWDQCSAEEKDRFDHIIAIYAAVVAHMDASVGRLAEGLQKRGLLDNTLILFLSDNGGNAESGPSGTLKGDPPGGPGSTVFCGQSWATLENTPFRRYKHYNHEGGISTPLIAHWPAGIPARGELRHQPGHLIDIMATCVDVGAAPYPKEFNGQPIQPMEGTSLAPAFADKPIPRDALYWEHEGNAAVRVGDYKLVRKGGGGQWELYDLVKDRTELTDLAGRMPDKVKELAAKWDAWAERCHVLEKKAGGTGDGSGAAAPKKKKGKA
ncbi:MAG: sulfatase-like hydrolase/transferase [Planctomycetota bacterium]|nr:sulfatase-like hydrolase/transferase [Planctomycetota bacterium]